MAISAGARTPAGVGARRRHCLESHTFATHMNLSSYMFCLLSLGDSSGMRMQRFVH